jgi:hypothetical protein
MVGASAMAGGPMVAAGVGAVGGTTGLIARLMANGMAKKDAEMAAAIARNGGNLNVADTDVVQQIMAALMAQSTAGPQ